MNQNRRQGRTGREALDLHEEPPADPLSSTKATRFKDTTEFKLHILNSKAPNPYNNYSVVSCTRNKDLEEDRYHEFLTFLVIDRRDKSYSKIFTERGHSADFTTLGKLNQVPIIQAREETATESALIHILPLQTLTFDENNMPTILHVAETLEKTHTIAPKYTKWRYHCYWYAGTVFNALRKEFKTSKVTNWSYWSTNSYVVPHFGKDKPSLQKVQNFDPTKMSHIKRLHKQRRQAMVDIFAAENKEWRAKWLAKLGLQLDPPAMKIPQNKVPDADIDLDLPEIPDEIQRDASQDKSKSEEAFDQELDEIANEVIDEISDLMIKATKGPSFSKPDFKQPKKL